mmetsp:Transcript_18108/g.42746  ORF Transcript_18108/g.42746 Transcript_18108/m.42746 type:complete len:1086 (-) Transcript_18108:45-3302(-)
MIRSASASPLVLLERLRQRQYSVDRLRRLYAQLVALVLYDNNNDSNDVEEDEMERRHWEEPQGPWSKLWSSMQQRKRRFHNKNKTINSSSSNDSTCKTTTRDPPLTAPPKQRRHHPRGIETAFLSMAANRTSEPTFPIRDVMSFESDHQNDDDEEDNDLRRAQREERRCVQLLSDISTVLTNAMGQQQQQAALHQRANDDDHHSNEGSAPTNQVFAYFGEKNILRLLLEMVRATPTSSSHHLRPVAWTAPVKAQALQTVAELVSSSYHAASSLYYVLSQDTLNQLVTDVLPLDQWTDPALEVLLPPYVDLLQAMALVLSDAPQLSCFFLQVPKEAEGETCFPLFSAILETTTSAYATSNSFVHSTCLNLLVDMMQISNSANNDHSNHITAIHDWIRDAVGHHQILAQHLCNILLARYRRMVNLCSGPVVDAIRSDALSAQWQGLREEVDSIWNDVLVDCAIRPLNVRLCEDFLSQVFCTLWKEVHEGYTSWKAVSSSPMTFPNDDEVEDGTTRPQQNLVFMSIGVLDADVIPEREAVAQVAVWVLATLLDRLRYRPLVRMLTVALLHPQTNATLWTNGSSATAANDDAYHFTPGLHQIAQGGTNDAELEDNFFRQFLFQTLAGDFGEWRAVAAAVLLEHVLLSPSMDADTLALVQLFPTPDHEDDQGCDLDRAVAKFLRRPHTLTSDVCTTAIECVSSLALHLLHKTVSLSLSRQHRSSDPSNVVGSSVPSLDSLRGLREARSFFFEKTLVAHSNTDNVACEDVFVDYMEAAVQNCYKRISLYGSADNSSSSSTRQRPSSRVHAYQLYQHSCAFHSTKSECLIRKHWSSRTSHAEEARWNAQMALHLRAVNNVASRFLEQTTAIQHTESSSVAKAPKLELLDRVGELEEIFGVFSSTPRIGSEIDLRFRSSFFCSSGMTGNQVSSALKELKDLRSMAAESSLIGSSTELSFVLDTVHLFVIRPTSTSKKVTSNESSRGIILCCIPLLNVIAAAMDGAWLHVAVRHDNVKSLIKNGNMALQFESAEISTMVRDDLNRSRRLLRHEVAQKLKTLLAYTRGDSRMENDKEMVTAEPLEEKKTDTEPGR